MSNKDFYTDLAFQSKKDDWGTPQDLFDKLNRIHNFDLDVCASDHNAKCKNYYTVEDNAFLQEWKGTCFMNPPYGKNIRLWIKKAYEESCKGNKIVCILPARTDTSYWHDYVFKYAEIEFLRGRLKFVMEGKRHAAPFPSAIVIFGANN